MQLSYCVGNMAAIGSCEKGRHVEGTLLLRWSTERCLSVAECRVTMLVVWHCVSHLVASFVAQ